MISACLSLAFFALVGKGAYLAVMGASETAGKNVKTDVRTATRADIVDRNGELLATTVTAYSLWANPSEIWDAKEVVSGLATVLPPFDQDEMVARLSNKDRKFEWIKRELTPRQRQAVFKLGLEGLGFQEESTRSYPRGTLAGHVLGFAGLDGNGLAGIEYSMDEQLTKGEQPVRLTIDNGVQAAVEAELSTGALAHGAIGGAAILMDARTGEVRALASWPPVNPHHARDLDRDDPARLNRATGAVYELGSIFKPLTVAAAIEAGSVGPRDMIDVSAPMEVNGAVIDDDHPMPGRASLTKIIAQSSNIGTVKVNMMLGARRQKAFLQSLGMFERADVELSGSAAPLLPERWDDLSAATMSYGHGIAVSPMAFLSAFSSLANDGELAAPTLIVGEQRRPAPTRVMSALTTRIVNAMMREAVVTGTGKRAEVAGYRVAGKTGTAEKPIAGGYDETRNVTSFAAVFPQDRPQYALIVMFDDPQLVDTAGLETGEVGGVTAAWNAAPTAGRIIERVAPLLGLAPRFEDVRPERLPFRSVSHERSDL